MKKSLLSLCFYTLLSIGYVSATNNDTIEINKDFVEDLACASDKNYVDSMGSFLAATWVLNTCFTMPLVSRFVTRQLISLLTGCNTTLFPIVGGVSVGFLVSVGTESMISFFILCSSKRYGRAILEKAKAITARRIPVQVIGIGALFDSIF